MNSRRLFLSKQLLSSKVSLRSSLLLSIIGQVAFALNALGQNILVAKLTNINEVGSLATATALLTPIALVFSLSLRTLVLSGENLDAFASYVRMRRYGIASFSLVSLAICLYVSDQSFAQVIAGVAVVKAVEMHFELYQARNLRLHHVSKVAVSHVLRTSSGLLALGLALLMSQGVVVGLFASATTSTIVGRIIDVGMSSENRKTIKQVDYPLLDVAFVLRSTMVVASIPLVETITQNMPRYFTGMVGTGRDVAIVSAVQYLTMPGITLASAFAAVMIPRMAEMYSAGEVLKYRQYVFLNIAAGLMLGAISSLAFGINPDLVMTIVFSREFSGHSPVVHLALAGGAVWYIAALCGNALTAVGKHSYNLASGTVGLLSSAGVTAYIWVLGAVEDILVVAIFGYCVGMAARLACSLWFLAQHIREMSSRSGL